MFFYGVVLTQKPGIGVEPHLRVVGHDGAALKDRKFPKDGFDHDAAMRGIIAASRALLGGSEVIAFGSVLVTKDVPAQLAELSPLAPLHQPHNLAPIPTVFEAAGHKPQVACFDTAFHRSQPPLAQAFSLPRRFSDEGVRRYGFHGISYEYLVARFRDPAPGTGRDSQRFRSPKGLVHRLLIDIRFSNIPQGWRLSGADRAEAPMRKANDETESATPVAELDLCEPIVR